MVIEMRIHYINLTNGIEAIPSLSGIEYRFIRIQSTLCEQKNWDRILQELDYDFLMNAALGNEIIVYDFGANKPIPKAVYLGLEFIKYSLYKRWLKQEYLTRINRTTNETIRKDCNSYFESCYKDLERRTKTKLDYFKPYVVGEIHIRAITASTQHDNDKNYYKDVLLREVAKKEAK